MANLVDHTHLASKFEAGDPEWFVRAAEAEVRRYCGWHIAPSEDVVGARYPAGERGLIILKSLHVTAVSSLVVDGRTLDQSEYDWEACGFITRTTPSWPRDRYVTVDFTHGHTECPANVAEVVFSLASRAIEMPASPARDITAGPFRLTLAGALGVTLTSGEERKLDTYRLQGVA